MANYKSSKTMPFATISQSVRLSNQVVLSVSTETYLVNKGVFFLEFLGLASGTVEIKDGDGVVIVAAMGNFSNDHSPLRCDGGITITGTFQIAKGFFLQDIFT